MNRVFLLEELIKTPLPVDAFLAVDTNILVQDFDESHQFHAATLRRIRDVKSRVRARMIYFQLSKLELQEGQDRHDHCS